MGRRGLTVGWITLGVIATSILAGCGGLPVWDQFDKIEVGRPLPAELPEGMERTHLGASLIAISKVEKEPPPDFAAGFRLADALCDDSGVVIAKSNLELNLAHRLLFIAGSYKYVIELDVPREAFRNLPWNCGAPRELSWAAVTSQIAGIWPNTLDSDEGGEPEEGPTTRRVATTMTVDEEASTRPVTRHLGTLDEVRGQVSAVMAQVRTARAAFMKASCGGWGLLVLSKRSIDALGPMAAGILGATARLACLPYVTDGEAGQYKPASVPEAVLYHKILLDAATKPEARGESAEREDEELAAVGVASLIYMKWVSSRVIELLSDRYALGAATTEGSDRIVLTPDGMSVRVRNLGGRRVRVEVGGFILRDPVIAPLMLLK